jgi:hypothetical protein
MKNKPTKSELQSNISAEIYRTHGNSPLRFQQPTRLKVSVSTTAYLLIFRNAGGQIVASRIGLLPGGLIGRREESALYALSVAHRMAQANALRVALVSCPALPPTGPGERRAA